MTTQTIPFVLLQDILNEGDEIFYVDLSNADKASIADSQASITITEDDGAPTLSVADATTTDESAAAITTSVTMSGPSASTITVDWATSDSTATAASDYNTAGGTLIFNPQNIKDNFS